MKDFKTRIKSIISFKKILTWISFITIIIIFIVGKEYLNNSADSPVQQEVEYIGREESSTLVDIVKTEYSRLKIQIISHAEGFNSVVLDEFETENSEIIEMVESMIESAVLYPEHYDLPDVSIRNAKRYDIELFSDTGGYSYQIYYRTMDEATYLEKDDTFYNISTDYARYVDLLFETDDMDMRKDAQAVELFRECEWTLLYKISDISLTLGDINNLSTFEPNAYYFAYNNELSKDIGLDMSSYVNSVIDVEIYRISEEMPPESNPNKNARGIVIKNDSEIIGAYISAGRHSGFSACSLKSNFFDEITGLTFNQWLESRVTTTSPEDALVHNTPEQVIEVYFEALKNKNYDIALSCLSREEATNYLTINMSDNKLFNESVDLPLTVSGIDGTEDPFGNLKSVKLVEIESSDKPDNTETQKYFIVTVNMGYYQEAILSSGEQQWECGMVYETPQTGWKIVGFGH